MALLDLKQTPLSRLTSLSQEALVDFCRRWKVAELAVFGSILGEQFGADSDVDLLISFTAEADWGLFDHAKMEQEIKLLLQRDVDLVSRRAIERSHNWIRRKNILKSAQVIYANG